MHLSATIDFSPLEAIVRKVIKEELETKFPDSPNNRLLSPEETCKMFKPAISKPTLESYSKKGWLTKHYLGGRTWFKESEIIAALEKISKYGRK